MINSNDRTEKRRKNCRGNGGLNPSETRPAGAGWVFRPKPDPALSCGLGAQIQPDPALSSGSRLQKERVLTRPAPVGGPAAVIAIKGAL
jgi:hypothetical protein